MMNIEARKQYMETLRERYLKANKKEKGEILNEYCRNTGQDRKYVIKKFRYKVKLALLPFKSSTSAIFPLSEILRVSKMKVPQSASNFY